MDKRKLMPFAAGGLCIAAAVAAIQPGLGLFAADHLDPPARTNPDVDSTPDRAADIADVYTWHNDTSTVIAVTFAGPAADDKAATYDRDVLYSVNISNEAPLDTTEIPIRVRFGTDEAGKFGVKVDGLPGVEGSLIGPVEKDLEKDGVKFRAGLFDDPFFFDLQGFKETVSTGTLKFDKTRNFFAGQNDTAFVIEIPKSRLDKGVPLGIWASTARFGGQK